jgi:hypothetical protein
VPALLAALALTGCSGEEGPVDDGTYSALEAGAPAILEGLGVTVLDLDRPAAATPADVTDALVAEEVDVLAYSERAITGLAVDPDTIGGLLGVVGTPALGSDFQAEQSAGSGETGSYVVLSFDQVDAALFFAQGEPEVFADPALDAERSTYVAGNLVAYYAPRGAADEGALRAALETLADAPASEAP